MIIAQLSVYPISEGTSLGRFVRKGVDVISRSGYKYEVGAMGTSVEVPGLDELFDLVKKVNKAHESEGAKRVIIDLKIDNRLDKDASMEGKKSSALKKT